MTSTTMESVLSRLPASTISVWAMVSAWFHRPPSAPCNQSAVIGMGFIVAILGLICWIRASVYIFNTRKQARGLTTWPWKLLAIVEASTMVLMFVIVVLATPPGSTCLLPSITPGTTKVNQTTLYNVLTISVLVSLIGPSILDWMLTLAEALGIQVRTDAPPQQADQGFMAHKGDHWMMHVYAVLHKHLHSERMQRLLWQLLPVTAVPVYKLATAYQANVANTTQCETSQRVWLLVLISVCGAISFALNLQSYERRWDEPAAVREDTSRSLYRTNGWLYNVWAIVQSAFTTAMFVGLALLTPPASTCLFSSVATTGTLLQNLSLMILLPMVGVALALALLRHHLASEGPSDEDMELSRGLSSNRVTSKASAAIAGYSITAMTGMHREDEDVTLSHASSDKVPVV